MTGAGTAPLTYAERIQQQHLEDRVAYAVDQLKQGNFLTIANGPDGRVAGICGLDPRRDRDFILGLVERKRRP
ncbi:hypothetical protein [Streptomyces ipomoeae]|uniref:hypothetical protein n=1 Tax=Streptomyces ipomoeae TaxID=103232 RepID=UPI001146A03F|nr:hypothetical protein [Streptomyces ipomoeae]TQE33162.1 hypothetical protein Sipo7851_21970 [Streptomyces ipomoeae]